MCWALTGPRPGGMQTKAYQRRTIRPMDRSSPSAAESVAEVCAALIPRTAEMSADIYELIVREIPQLRSDKRVLELLEASVAENVATALHILQHGIDPEKAHAPAAAEEYARRLAQRGVPIAALLRAYRIGSARFEDWCLQELGRHTANAAVVSGAGLRIAAVLASYIDKVSEELVVRAEQQFQAAGQQDPDVSLSAAAVTAVHRGKPQPVQAQPQIVPGGQHNPQLLRAAHQQQLQLAQRLGRAQFVGIVDQQPGLVLQRLQVRQQPLDERPAIQIWCRGQGPHQRRTGRGLPEGIEY